MTELKPIETHYAGCRFRSRIEARWAVFFDQVDIPWAYESQGFALPSGPYLPDFLLWPEYPTVSGWFEVKGALPTSREKALAQELAEATGQVVWLAFGDMPRDSASGNPMLGFSRGQEVRRIPVAWFPTGHAPSLDVAFGTARSARFEHGETARAS